MEYTSLNDKFRGKSVQKIKDVVKNEKMSRNIEKGIYNYSIELAKKKNIVRLWENPVFKNLYMNKLISVYSNLKKNLYWE